MSTDQVTEVLARVVQINGIELTFVSDSLLNSLLDQLEVEKNPRSIVNRLVKRALTRKGSSDESSQSYSSAPFP